ncbi:polynucleotide 5'-phosphatase [Hanseniaspora uvarum]|nr:polynucleotide 5'-phosphatase [Hanseniaspora uvarum]
MSINNSAEQPRQESNVEENRKKISINNLMNNEDISPVKKETNDENGEETDTDKELNDESKKDISNAGVEFNNVGFEYDDDEGEISLKSEDFDIEDEEEEKKKPQAVEEQKTTVEVKKEFDDQSIAEKRALEQSSAESKKQSIKKAKVDEQGPTEVKKEKKDDDALLRLAKIAEESQIDPNKKKEIPIWARKWVPKQKENLVSKGAEEIEGSNEKRTTNVNVGEYGLDEEGIPKNFRPSYTSVEPDCDIVQAIQQWVYAQLVSIPIEERNFIEIELKFGKLTGDNEVDRINLPISTETIYTNIDGHLLPTIDESLFKELIKHMITTTENNPEFNIMESEMIDSIYRINDFYNHKRPRFLRLSKDYKTGRIFEFIEKKNLSNLLIYTPRDTYDMKLSLNLEVPLDPNDEPPEKFVNETPIHLRRKKRSSYIHNDSFTRFDLTEVINKKQSGMANDGDRSQIHNTFEVELEMNPQVLVKCIDYINKDSTKFATLVRNFIHNAQLIRRKMTQLSGEIYQGKKKV